MKKISEYLLERLTSETSVAADLSGDIAAVERREIVGGDTEAGRALIAELLLRIRCCRVV